MPSFVDAFPQNYGVTNNPLDRLSVDPMQFINGVETPFGGTAANPIGNPLTLITTGLNNGIHMLNQVITAEIPDAPVLLPDITQLMQMLQPCLSANGLLSGFLNGVPFANLLFGGLSGTGPGSGAGLFGQSALFNPGSIFGGFANDVPVLSQLISAIGGSGNTLADFEAALSGLGTDFTTVANDLIGLFPHTIGGLVGSIGLGNIFTDITGLLGSPTSLGGGSPALPSVGSIPLLGGLFSGSAFSTSLIPNITKAMSTDLQSVVTNIFGTSSIGTVLQLPAIPSLPTGQITSGVFSTGLIPNITKAMSTDLQSVITNIFGTSSIGTILQTGAIPNITLAMSNDMQTLLDYGYQAMNGGSSTNNTLSAWKTSLQNIPHVNVLGNLGPTTLGDSVQAVLDYGWQAVTGGSATGKGLADWGTALSQLTNFLGWTPGGSAPSTSVGGITQTNAQSISNMAIYKAVGHAIDSTADAVFDISSLMVGTAPTINVSPTVSAIGNLTAVNGGVKKSVWWYAPALPGAGVTSVVLNVYSINPTTKVKTPLCSSTNLFSSCVVGWNDWQIPTANYISANQGDMFGVEMEVIGGTYAILGYAGHFLAAHPTAGQLGESRGPSSPTFLHAGPGMTASSLGPNNMTDNIPANTDCYIVAVHHFDPATAQSSVVKCGGITMTNFGSNQYYVSGANDYNLNLYYLLKTSTQAIPTGSQTISVTFTGGQKYCEVNSFSYSGVSSIGTGATASGTSAAPAQTIAGSTANSLLLHFVGQVGANTLAHASGAGTIRWTNSYNNGSKPMCAMFEDAPGSAGSLTFTDSSNASSQWGSVIIQLNGVVATAATITTPTYSSNVPWFSLAGGAGVLLLTPQTNQYNTAGSYTYTVPTQFQYAGAQFDIIALGAGAGGDAFGHGGGGLGGNFTTITLTYGTDIPLGTTSFSVTVGAGGAGTNTFAQNAGGNSSVTITGYGTITGTGGAWPGGTNANNGGNTSPGSVTVNGNIYQGGLGGSTGYQNGNPPGGGGGSGTQSFTAGGTGADGSVWIRAHQ